MESVASLLGILARTGRLRSVLEELGVTGVVARRVMTRLGDNALGALLAALVGRIGAARREDAALGQVHERLRLAELAQTREEKMKAAAEKAARRDNERAREKALQKAREATAEREAAERKAEADRRRNREEMERERRRASADATISSVDRKLSGSFEANRGRLPMPITGTYRIVSHFGQNNVEGLKGVTIDNKGINILGSPGCKARAIFNGEVSAVFGFGGSMVVMVRHGIYISVYCNLSSVSVHRGQSVSTGQQLGTVARDNILQFQLRRNLEKLNPESWLR